MSEFTTKLPELRNEKKIVGIKIMMLAVFVLAVLFRLLGLDHLPGDGTMNKITRTPIVIGRKINQ